MATIRLEIVTIEGKVFDEEVNMVVAPGVEGVMGILPRHAPLLTRLNFGELQIKRDGQPDEFFAVGGGVMEVQGTQVIVLADSAESVDAIDLARAEEARQRAEELLAQASKDQVDFQQAEAALRRSANRIKLASRHRQKGGYGMQSPDGR